MATISGAVFPANTSVLKGAAGKERVSGQGAISDIILLLTSSGNSAFSHRGRNLLQPQPKQKAASPLPAARLKPHRSGLLKTQFLTRELQLFSSAELVSSNKWFMSGCSVFMRKKSCFYLRKKSYFRATSSFISSHLMSTSYRHPSRSHICRSVRISTCFRRVLSS